MSLEWLVERFAPANLMLGPAALLPVGAALGVAITGRPVSWFPAVLVSTCLVVAMVAAQKTYREETGRRRHVHAAVRLSPFTSMFGVAYAVEPWSEPFDVIASMGMQAGCAIVSAGVVAALWIADAAPTARSIVGHVLFAPFLGAMCGIGVLFATIPLGMLWLEDWFPGTHREPFALALGGGLAGAVALVHWLATRRK